MRKETVPQSGPDESARIPAVALYALHDKFYALKLELADLRLAAIKARKEFEAATEAVAVQKESLRELAEYLDAVEENDPEDAWVNKWEREDKEE